MIQTQKDRLQKKIKDITHRFLFSIFAKNAKQILKRKCSFTDEKTRLLIMHEDERYHYGDIEISEKASEYVLKSFTIDRIKFIRQNILCDKEDIIIDLGDSNGIFLRSMAKDGVSVNISDPAIAGLKSKGMECVKADIEYLPFKNNSIQAVFLFQTFEHVSNPISLLKEIERVCRECTVLSIPYVRKTNIMPYNYAPGVPIHQHHIFEFTPRDFSSIVSHTNFSVSTEKVATVLDGKSGIFDRIVFLFWNIFIEKDMFCGCFKKFYICKLVKTTTETKKRNS